MSRCFPYPPPGYPGIEESRLTLIESIKLQREWEPVKAKAKKDRKIEKKGRKRDKKDRKEKKEKSKTSILPEKEILKSRMSDVTSLTVVKLLETENEKLERSSLTEEHAIQASQQKPSTSSDSTHTSSKRQREEVNPIRGTGNVIRIRLSSRKQNAEVSKPDPCFTLPPIESPSQTQNAVISRQQPCSTSGRAQLATCNKQLATCNKHGGQVDVRSVKQGNNNVISVRLPKPEANRTCSALIPKVLTREGNTAAVSQFRENKLPLLPPKPEREASLALVGPKVSTREDDIVVRDPKSLNKKLVKAELRYKDLFSNWVPPPPQKEVEPDDQDWLFAKKKLPDNQSDKKLKPSNNVACWSSSLLFPRAQFIPEADIYALPFTVPF